MGPQLTNTKVLLQHKLSCFNFFIFEFASAMSADYFLPSTTADEKLVQVKAELDNWMKANPGVLFKVGGKTTSSLRHRDATHYARRYYNTASAYIFSGILIDSRQAAWLELELMKYAYFKGYGVNHNRSSPRNMAVLPGSPYNYGRPGCLYLVPVVATITSQTQYFTEHVSHHVMVKQRIANGSYVKGQQDTSKRKKQDPSKRKKRAPYGVRGTYKKQDPLKRKAYTKRAPSKRGTYKKQDPSKRKKSKKQDPSKRKAYKKRAPYGVRGTYKKRSKV
jgi:hypothetical protein